MMIGKAKSPLPDRSKKSKTDSDTAKEGKCTIIVLSYIGLLTHDATMKMGGFGHLGIQRPVTCQVKTFKSGWMKVPYICLLYCYPVQF